MVLPDKQKNNINISILTILFLFKLNKKYIIIYASIYNVVYNKLYIVIFLPKHMCMAKLVVTKYNDNSVKLYLKNLYKKKGKLRWCMLL